MFARRSKLQDAVPASPYDEVDATVKEQLGRPLAELFATVDREALASASVAQVHRCTLKDGRKAVVKVSTYVHVSTASVRVIAQGDAVDF